MARLFISCNLDNSLKLGVFTIDNTNLEKALPEYGINYYVMDAQKPSRYDEIRRIINSKRFQKIGKFIKIQAGGTTELKKVLQKIQDICNKYSFKMGHLMATIDYISEFNPKYINPKSLSVGLIAFKPETDKSSDLNSLKLTKDQVLSMNIFEQLDLIDKYLAKRSTQFSEEPNLAEVFTAIALGVVIPSKDKTPPWDLNSIIFSNKDISNITNNGFLFGNNTFGELDKKDYPGITANASGDNNLQLGELLSGVIELSILWETTTEKLTVNSLNSSSYPFFEQTL